MAASRRAVGLPIAAGVGLTLALRAPWLDAALGRDEGGVALVAHSLHGGGPFAYGSTFLDRPPLLVELYRLAVAHGAIGIRVLGAVAAGLLVVISTLLAVRLGGRRAAPFAAAISAVLASSFALDSVFTPAELLAAVPSSASVLLLITALERQCRRHRLLAGAGALAVAALLVKQSFGDALAAGAVALAAGPLAGVPARATLRRAAAYGAGIVATAMGLVAWEQLVRPPDGSVWFAVLGFRLDAVHSLTGTGFGAHLGRLERPALTSGLAVALVVAAVGVASIRGRPVVRAAVAAWMLAALGGIAAGGSYWPHYLVALVPVTAAGAATLLARQERLALSAAAVAALAIPACAISLRAAIHDTPDGYQRDALAVARYLRAHAAPGQTAYVLYAKVNALYYSGLRSPYPYDWSLMVRSAPHAQARLRRLLASPRRPTWIVRWQGDRDFGLDRSGATERLLRAHYRRVATVAGRPVLRRT